MWWPLCSQTIKSKNNVEHRCAEMTVVVQLYYLKFFGLKQWLNFPEWVYQCPPLYSVRAEGLKESHSKSTPAQTGPPGTKPSSSAGSVGPVRQFFPLGPDFSLHDRPQPQPVRAVQSSEPQGQRYTSEEIEVLRWDLKNYFPVREKLLFYFYILLLWLLIEQSQGSPATNSFFVSSCWKLFKGGPEHKHFRLNVDNFFF